METGTSSRSFSAASTAVRAKQTMRARRAICSGSRQLAKERNMSVPIISQSVSSGCCAESWRSVSTV